jgi:hypothetical protein
MPSYLPHRALSLALLTAAVLVVALALLLAVNLLPPAPLAPTPTWPLGIDLPEKLPRIPR